VSVRCSFNTLRVLTQQRARGVQLTQRRLGLAEQTGLVESDRGVRPQGDQERDVIAVKGALAAVCGEEHTDHVGPDDQGHPEDRDQTLLGDRIADRARLVNRVSSK